MAPFFWIWCGMAWADFWTLLAYGFRPGIVAALGLDLTMCVILGAVVFTPRASA